MAKLGGLLAGLARRPVPVPAAVPDAAGGETP
jgi:hypothetical protein